MSAAAEARREAFLLAFPAGHSVSPAMHQAAFDRLGLDATYRALEVAPQDLAQVVEGFRDSPTFLGANVTVPHKVNVMALLDELTDEARSIGAVNTIVRRGARLIGSNTDAAGFSRSLEELLPPLAESRSARALVLGAGGSARAVVWALLRGGGLDRQRADEPRRPAAGHVPTGFEVGVFARRPEAARALVAELGGGVAVTAAEVDDWFRGSDVLVNTTPVGMAGGGAPGSNPAPAPLGELPRHAAVLDLVYRPAVTPLLEAAIQAGLPHANGLEMLVWQGAYAFETWTGRPAPVAVMRAAAAAALAR